MPIILDISEEKSKFLTADINNILGLGIVDFTAERGEVTESLEDVREFDVSLTEIVMPVALTHDSGDNLDVEGPFSLVIESAPLLFSSPGSLVKTVVHGLTVVSGKECVELCVVRGPRFLNEVVVFVAHFNIPVGMGVDQVPGGLEISFSTGNSEIFNFTSNSGVVI